MTEKQISLKIYNSLIQYSIEKNISLRKEAKLMNVKYTTFMTWLENLKKGKCISVENILKIEKFLGEKFFIY